MNEDTNIVLEGNYKDQKINFDSQAGLVWIGRRKNNEHDNFFYQENIKQIIKLDAKESSLSSSATFWFGLQGYLMTAGVQDYLLEVTWSSGSKSLIKVRDGVYEMILRNQTKNKPQLDYESIYNEAIALYNIDDYFKVSGARRKFGMIKEYKDSATYINRCDEKMEQLSGQRDQAITQGRKSINKFLIITSVVVGILAGGSFALNLIFPGVLFTIVLICVLIIFFAFRSANKK